MKDGSRHFALAITRTCGSGGSLIGKELALFYGIDLYDRKLLQLATEDSGINETIFAEADEITRKTLLYRSSKRVYNGEVIPPESGNFLSDQNLFNYQYHTGRQWKNPQNYDLCLNTQRLGRKQCVELIEDYVRLKFGVITEKKVKE